MTKIALVGVTLNAINPMTRYFQKKGGFAVAQYLDSCLQSRIRSEGGISDTSMRRMFDMLATACADGAEAVLITCTIFSPYADAFSQLLSKPVICPDRAMLESAARAGGKTLILCTFPSTAEPTGRLYDEARKKAGRDEGADLIVLEAAGEAAVRGDLETHNRLIREKALELDEACDQIVFAQISMADAALGLSLKHAKIYTSPDSAYEEVLRAVRKDP